MRTRDIFEPDLETPSFMLAHRGACIYSLRERRKGRRERRKEEGWNLLSTEERKGI